jgi:hypothetical protein
MKNSKKSAFVASIFSLCLFSACGKEKVKPQLHFKVKFDTQQLRLNNLGQPVNLPANHAAQTPKMNSLGIHYLELATNATTLLGKGSVVYKTPEVTTGGTQAIDFEQVKQAKDSEIMFSMPLENLAAGTYEWVRASVAYQNFNILFNIWDVPNAGNFADENGTAASYLGYNSYLKTIKVRDKTLPVNGNKKQGFWAFETQFNAAYSAFNRIYSGQAPEGSTTVVNPLFASAPIPAGSCVVTGSFEKPLTITGSEENDVTVVLSFSVNKSFEWEETLYKNGKWDIASQPLPGKEPAEKVVDMGLRGLKVKVE